MKGKGRLAEDFRRLATETALWRPITNSIAMSGVATGANLVFCFIAAYIIVLTRAPGRRMIQMSTTIPWAIPATAIALGIAALGEFVASVVLFTHAPRPIPIEVLQQLRNLSACVAFSCSV